MIYLALKRSMKLFMRAACGGAAALRLALFKTEKEVIGGEEAFKRLCKVYPFREVDITCENSIEHKYDLQIIVPAYNVEKYIEKCISGIAAQETDFSVRIVAVDDGSKDATGKILDELLEKFENGSLNNAGALKSFEVIHSENEGLSAARNKGLKNISAEYIMFCDSDDVLMPGAVEKLMKTAVSCGADIAEGSIEAVDENGRVYDRFIHEKGEISPMKLFGYAHSKVIKAVFFKNIKFPEGYLFEDAIIKYCVCPFVNKCMATDEIVYAYLRNMGGISKKSLKSERAVSTFYLTAVMWEYMGERTEKISVDIRRQLLRQIALNHRRTCLLGKEISTYGFWYMRECYLKFDGRGGCDGLPLMYKLLHKAVVKGDYKSAALLCRRELYL